MTPAEKALLARIQRRAAGTMDPKRVLAAYDMIRQTLTPGELIMAQADGTLEALLTELLSDGAVDPVFAPLRQQLERTMQDATTLAKGDLPKRFQVGGFNPYDPHIASVIRSLADTYTRKIKEEMRESVMTAVSDGMQQGLNPRAIARNIRSSVGLSPNQTTARDRFRAQLVAGDRAALNRALGRNTLRNTAGKELVRKGHAGGFGLNNKQIAMLKAKLGKEPLSAAEIDKIVDAYAKRLEAFHAETLTRTASLDAQRNAQRLATEDAIQKGVMERDRVTRTWITVGDSRVRPEHAEMNGETVGMNERYSNGEEIPGELTYNCRCIERYGIKPEPKAPDESSSTQAQAPR